MAGMLVKKLSSCRFSTGCSDITHWDLIYSRSALVWKENDVFYPFPISVLQRRRALFPSKVADILKPLF